MVMLNEIIKDLQNCHMDLSKELTNSKESYKLLVEDLEILISWALDSGADVTKVIPRVYDNSLLRILKRNI